MTDATRGALEAGVLVGLNGPGHDVKVKRESRECMICSNRTDEPWFDVFWTETRGGRAPIVAYICRVAQVRLSGEADAVGGVACTACIELVNLLERAELEFQRLRESFTAIIAENSAFESSSALDEHKDILIDVVKEEKVACETSRRRRDSDDEPLAARKKRGRRPGRRRGDTAEGEVPVVKVEVEPMTSGPNHRFECPVLEESEPSADEGGGWNAEDNHEPDDNDYTPTTSKVKLKRKERSEENGKKHKQRRKPGPKSKTKQDDAVEGEDHSQLVVRDYVPVNEWGDRISRTNDVPVVVVRKRRKHAEVLPKVSFNCNECPAKFTSSSRLTFHLRKHEVSAKAPFICEICGAHYKHKRACDIHVAMHKGISDWKCEECNKLFPSKGALHRHNAIHTGKPNYQCDLCGKSFIHTSSFKMHKLSHTGLKPHACDVCGLALMTRSHLKRHKRIHSGEKRHECTVCGKKFSERYNLLAHQKSHDSPAPGQPPPGQPPPRRPWQGFRCHVCDKRFVRRYMVERHMEVEHQRIMEKEAPKPRNTMTKLLKAQAAAVIGKAVLPGGESGAQPTATKAPADVGAEAEPERAAAPPADQDAPDDAHKSSPRHTAPVAREHSSEWSESVRLVNGAWGGAGACIPVEYGARDAGYPQ